MKNNNNDDHNKTIYSCGAYKSHGERRVVPPRPRTIWDRRKPDGRERQWKANGSPTTPAPRPAVALAGPRRYGVAAPPVFRAATLAEVF